MTLITDMTLPDAVVDAAWAGYMGGRICDMRSAIRAALQAMLDCGMAREGALWNYAANRWSADAPPLERHGQIFPALIIRLDADERKEQT